MVSFAKNDLQSIRFLVLRVFLFHGLQVSTKDDWNHALNLRNGKGLLGMSNRLILKEM